MGTYAAALFKRDSGGILGIRAKLSSLLFSFFFLVGMALLESVNFRTRHRFLAWSLRIFIVALLVFNIVASVELRGCKRSTGQLQPARWSMRFLPKTGNSYFGKSMG
jgi:hypothetical protein